MKSHQIWWNLEWKQLFQKQTKAGFGKTKEFCLNERQRWGNCTQQMFRCWLDASVKWSDTRWRDCRAKNNMCLMSQTACAREKRTRASTSFDDQNEEYEPHRFASPLLESLIGKFILICHNPLKDTPANWMASNQTEEKPRENFEAY